MSGKKYLKGSSGPYWQNGTFYNSKGKEIKYPEAYIKKIEEAEKQKNPEVYIKKRVENIKSLEKSPYWENGKLYSAHGKVIKYPKAYLNKIEENKTKSTSKFTAKKTKQNNSYDNYDYNDDHRNSSYYKVDHDEYMMDLYDCDSLEELYDTLDDDLRD